MKKVKYDIEVKDSDKICGGYIYTTDARTKKQVAIEMEKLGKELIRNTEGLNKVSYQAWEADNEDYENAACVFVTVKKEGRKFHVLSY